MKKGISIFFIICLFFCCCTNDSKNEKEELPKVNIEKQTQETITETESNMPVAGLDTLSGYKFDFRSYKDKKWKYYYKEVEEHGRIVRMDKDYIETRSILIDGILPNFSQASLMIEKLGQPDSIITFHNEMDDSKGKLYFYPDLEIRVHDFDSLIRLESLRFASNGTFIEYKGTIYNSNTDLVDFQKQFPLSYLNASSKEDYNNQNVTRYWLDFCTSGKQYTDDKYTITFENGKLLYLSYWEPM